MPLFRLLKIMNWRIGRVLTLSAVGLLTLSSSAAAQRTGVRVDVGVGDVHVGVQVETRGAVHEAFAEPVVFEPEPGLIVQQAPPPPIEEAPPDDRPMGEDVQWVSGYWSWDDDGSDYVWTSGIWRNLPPGREFVPGYWAQTPGGHQWVSGFWMQSRSQAVEYLPAPPPLRVEPAVIAPAPDHIWVPGAWVWRLGRYVWRSGYWLAPVADWTWVPPHYVWTPSGYVFINGYWDHVLPRRGLLFAPVRVDRAVIARRGFVYTPTVVVNTQVLIGSLFARPRYTHYYFGDYYAVEYSRAGILPVYTFQRSLRGYSSIYAHTVAIERRRDSRWEDRLVRQYEVRRDRVDARPPRTWAAMERAQERQSIFADENTRESLVLARSLKDIAGSRDAPVRIERLPEQARVDARRGASDLRRFQDRRRQLEMEAAPKSPGRSSRAAPDGRVSGGGRGDQPGGGVEPLRLNLPQSPVAGRRTVPRDADSGRSGERSSPRSGGRDDTPREPRRSGERRAG